MDRIHKLNNSLKKEFGSPISFGDHTFYAYPTLDQLSSIEEDTFRDLSFGYRSKYIVNTVEQVINGNPSLPSQDTDMSRSELHECLSEYYGVGDKIADCVQLYSYNHSVVPMDTWTKKLADAFEPDEDLSTYLQYQQALESHLRPDKEGVDQLFAYHLLTSTDYFLKDVSHL
jgi:N-glycosylase/DNA lyase